VYSYDRQEPGRHLIFGYLEVQGVYDLGVEPSCPAWLEAHPHVDNRQRTNNLVFSAASGLNLVPGLPGAGMLSYCSDRVLTKVGHNRSHWDLPAFFQELKITYHDKSNWRGDHFRAAARGQEFVIESTPALSEWARALILDL
jgi:hypothetical protein